MLAHMRWTKGQAFSTLTLIATAWFASIGHPVAQQNSGHEKMRVLEIRSYNLKPGRRDQFHHLVVKESLPLLARYKVDVVAYGPSLQETDSYFLMRSYASLEDCQRTEDALYGSDDWKKGPREAIMADIENYTTVVLQVDEETLTKLRKLTPS